MLKKNRIRAIHAKIKNTRNNQLHQFSTELVKAYAAIVIGNINSKALAKTKLAKSVLDAGWSSFKTMLRYKCENAGADLKKYPNDTPPKLARVGGIRPDESER